MSEVINVDLPTPASPASTILTSFRIVEEKAARAAKAREWSKVGLGAVNARAASKPNKDETARAKSKHVVRNIVAPRTLLTLSNAHVGGHFARGSLFLSSASFAKDDYNDWRFRMFVNALCYICDAS